MVPVNSSINETITTAFTDEELTVLKDLIQTEENVNALKELIANKDKLIQLLNQ